MNVMTKEYSAKELEEVAALLKLISGKSEREQVEILRLIKAAQTVARYAGTA